MGRGTRSAAGKNTINCHSCNESDSTGSWLVCDTCNEQYHAKCINIDDTIAAMMLSLKATVGWVCPSCRSELSQIRSTGLLEILASVKEEIRQLRADFDAYKLTHPEPPVIWPEPSASSTVKTCTVSVNANETRDEQQQNTRNVLAAVHNELNDKNRRKCNVIVSGLKEVNGEDDVMLFSQLCEQYLPVKPSVNRERCRRLGTKMPGKIRPFLVTLANENSVSELLQCARLLRQSSNADGIYINPDLTPAESLAAFQARERRRAKRNANNLSQTEGAAGDHTPCHQQGKLQMASSIQLSVGATEYKPQAGELLCT